MEVLQGSPLKTPAIEVVPVSSHLDPVDGEKPEENQHDASSPEADEDDDDDQLSLYEDMLDGMPDQADGEGGLSLWIPLFPWFDSSLIHG